MLGTPINQPPGMGVYMIVPGFALLAINAFAAGFDLVGALFFVLSLGFKQMSLYYAPPIGAYLLGKCIFLGPKEGYGHC